jgi:hypothetical protein
MSIDIYQDKQTVSPKELSRDFKDWHDSLGHVFDGHDGFVYRMIGWRRDDGPWIEEVLGRTQTRTVSSRAIGRTFHHSRSCPVPGCSRALVSVPEHYTTDWSGVEQSCDGKKIWINDKSGACIGRLSPMGIDVHAGMEGQLAGTHCLFCAHAEDPSKRTVDFADYVLFVEKMKEHHGVEVNRRLRVAYTPLPSVLA